MSNKEELSQDMEYAGPGDEIHDEVLEEVTTDAQTDALSADDVDTLIAAAHQAHEDETEEDRIRRIIVEELAAQLPDDQLTPAQHYVRQQAATVINILAGDDNWLTYLSRNLQGVNIRAINRLLTESSARAPVPKVVSAYVPGSLRLMAREVQMEDGTRRIDLDSVEVFKTEEKVWTPVAIGDEEREALVAIVVDAGAELGTYQYLTSDIDLEAHQKVVLEMFNK